jgi:hypothetical protein
MKIIQDRPGSVDMDEVLSRPLFAHLSTASDEGPRDSPVWFLWEDGAVWIIGSSARDTFPARIEAEPRCAIGVVDFEVESGRVLHVGMRGVAAVERFDRARAQRLLSRYLGADPSAWDPRFQATLSDPDNVLVRFVAETVVARDVSYSTPGD